MVDAPEKIWIDQDDCPYFYEESELAEAGSPVTEYIRADLCHPPALEPSAAREQALEEGYRQGIEDAAQKAAEMLVFADTTSTADREIPAAIRALAVVKEYLTARRPSEQAVTEAMELARAVLAQSITAGHNVPGPTPEDIEKAFWALDAALKSAMEAGR